MRRGQQYRWSRTSPPNATRRPRAATAGGYVDRPEEGLVSIRIGPLRVCAGSVGAADDQDQDITGQLNLFPPRIWV